MPRFPKIVLYSLFSVILLTFAASPTRVAAQASHIAAISPTSLSPGMQATLTGTGFGASPGVVGLQNQNSVPIVSWSDTQIVVTVPAGTIPGHAFVFQNGAYSNQVSFTMVPPTLTAISPTSLRPGMQATLTGSGFGASPGFVGLQNQNSVPIVSWSDTQIVVTVPAGTIPGHANVYQNGVYSNPVSFTMVPPTLTAISPTSLSPGMQATLTGSGFGASPGFVGLQNQNSVPIVSWSDTQIVVTVPAGTIPGHANVYQNGVYSNPVSFTMVPPTLTAISPTSLSPGMQATLTGSGFGASPGFVGLQNQNSVPIVSWSDTQIVVTVPAGTIPGHANVYQNGVYSNPVSFTMVPPTLTLISPTGLAPGMQATLTGSGFGPAPGGVELQNNWATVVSWSDTQAVVTVPAGTIGGTANVYQNGVFSNGKPFTIMPPPTLTSLSPTSGAVGTSITLTGTNFGASQSNSSVTFNGTVATPTSWSSTSIAVPVPSAATTGNVVVTVGAAASNGVSFTVLVPPSITSVSPTSGIPGTSVTITGTGFGSTQGSGTVWLGSINGVVISWSDTQVVATVAAGSTSGTAKIMQGGVWSNAVNFTVIAPQVSSVTPTSALVGGQVTITGSGFGATQGSGSVWLGSTYGVVISWSDTQVIAAVASGSQTGSAKIFQYGVWSNALDFTVQTSPPPTGVILTPSAVSMVVGETRTLQAADAQGQPFHGLTWSSSDPTVASLSTDDPPIITALAPGHTTITAADGSADITVYPGPSLPIGTIKWSIPDDGSGVSRILPAVPSDTGVADIFALQYSGKLMAITADGFISWTADVGTSKTLLPDFQGGMVLADQQSVQKLDGITGQAQPAYSYAHPPSFGSSPTAVHTDGTIFTVDGDQLVGINPQTGAPKFGITMDDSVYDQLPYCEFPVANHSVSPPTIYQLAIAGDGNAYVAYSYSNENTDPQIIGNCNSGYDNRDFHLRVLRAGVDGTSQKISIGDWTQNTTCAPNAGGQTICSTAGSIPLVNGGSIITNADQGILFAWTKSTNFNSNDPVTQLVPISASGAGTTATMAGYAQAVVQQQDGTFVGTLYNTQLNASQMIRFDQSGSLKWSVTGDYQPQIATADGGVIAQNWDTGASVTFDSNGMQTGQIDSLPTQSWLGNSYEIGSVHSIAVLPTEYAASYAASAGGNPSAGSSLNPAGVTYVPTLGAIYRAKIAELAKGHVGDTDTWREGGLNPAVTCNIFVKDVLNEASDATSLQIPAPTRPPRKRFGIFTRIDAFLAADWANPGTDAGCWKVLPAGPDGALPGDVLATGFPVGGTDGTGHVGLIVDPGSEVSNQKLASAADSAPYWWTTQQKDQFIPGTITLTDYGFRLPGFDASNPSNNQGLKQDSLVRRFECY